MHVDSLYRYFAQHASVRFDGRDHEAREGVNSLLTYGNYIAYGLAATALHGLGISFAFPVMHGKRVGIYIDTKRLRCQALLLRLTLQPETFMFRPVTRRFNHSDKLMSCKKY